MSHLDLSMPFKSKKDWNDWLRSEVNNRIKSYESTPAYLSSETNREYQTTKDYAGRELLELVQNAADAAAKDNIQGRVYIRISESHMLIANTGCGFCPSGVQNIMLDSRSDKRGTEKSKRLIGEKGLGFRSLLNWSEEPLIVSKKLAIAFSKEHSKARVIEVGKNNPAIQREVAEYGKANNGRIPAPILSFPIFGKELADKKKSLLEEVQELIDKDKFHTVIALVFSGNQAFDEAVRQSEAFSPRFLLFVNNVSEITIEVQSAIKNSTVCWKSKRDEANGTLQLTIQSNNRPVSEGWICRTASHEIHKAELDENDAATHYEIGVGFRLDKMNEPGMLHCYFPTNIPVPLPALFHGTLEVTSNREGLVKESKHNECVLKELGRFYAEKLCDLLENKKVSEEILDWLVPRSEFSQDIACLGTSLYARAGELPLVPTINRTYLRASEAVLPPPIFVGEFPKFLFDNLARVRNDNERRVLQEMNVRTLTAEEVVSAALSQQLSLEQRTEVIIAFSKQYFPEYKRLDLFIDDESQSLSACKTCFPPPESGAVIELPSWVKTKFIGHDLWNALKSRLGNATRATVDNLKSLGVQEYSLSSVIELMLDNLGEVITKANEDALRKEIVASLHRLYFADKNHKNTKFPNREVLVKTQGQGWKPADEVHLSSGYGMSGTINELLYAGKPQLLLGEAVDQGVADKPENLALFFQWIGVNEWPRSVKLSNPVGYYWDVVKSALGDPVWANDQNGAAHPHNKQSLFLGSTVKLEAGSIEGLDDILSNASCEAILAWLSKDARFSESHKFGCTLQVSTGRSSFRPVLHELPDLVRYRIRNTKWLKCSDGKTRTPLSVIQAPPHRLSQAIPHPIGYQVGFKERYGLDKSDWDRGLSHASVPPTLNYIEQEYIYEMLSGLKNSKLTPEQVRSFYSMLFDQYAPQECNESVVEFFLNNGKLQSKLEDSISWLAPKEIIYIDVDGIPNQIRRKIPCLDLPSNFPTDWVYNIFRVHSLSGLNYTRTNSDPTDASEKWVTCISSMFEASKRFISAIINDSDNSRRTNLESLEIRPVSSMALTVTYNNNSLCADMDAWTYCLDQNCLYIAVDESHEPSDMRMLLAEAVGNGISEYLGMFIAERISALINTDNDYARITLLKRWLPNLTGPEIDTLMISPHEPQLIEPTPVVGLQTEIFQHKQPTESILPDENQALEEQAQSQEPHMYHAEVTDLPSPVVRDKTSITHRLRETEANQDRTLSVAKGKRAEDIVLAYEEFVGGFPLYVGNQQGTDAYGCDIISFDTREAREKFNNNTDRSLISRFIEVKSSVVTFTKNEENSAREYNDRFYVYQVKVKQCHVDLAIVCNPLSFESALDVVKVIDIGKVPESERSHKRITLVPN